MEEKEFVKNALKIMEFEEENINANLVQFVNMWEYKVATKEKPMLLTVGLQSCIALYAWEENFAYLAHMNIVGGNSIYDFETTDNDIPIKCKKIDRLQEEILKQKENIKKTIYIGLVLGVTPKEEDYPSRMILEKDLKELSKKLQEEGTSTIRVEDINSFSFILDARNGNIIQGENNPVIHINERSNSSIKGK